MVHVPRPPVEPSMTSRSSTVPLETVVRPTPPSPPIRVELLVTTSCPPVIHTVPVELLLLPAIPNTVATLVPPTMVNVPCEPTLNATCRPAICVVQQQFHGNGVDDWRTTRGHQQLHPD